MRIDFVITELFPGGAERCLTQLAISCAASGDDVRVFSIGSLPDGPSAILVDRLRDAGIEVETASADSSLRFGLASRRLSDWLLKRPPEICQTFLFHANVIGTLAAAKRGVPVRVGGLRVAELNWIRCKIERHAAKRMTSLACVSGALQTFASEKLGVDADRSVVIPNAVDVSRFSSAESFDWTSIGWPADSIVTLFVGRMHSQKGIDLLQEQIDAIAPPGFNRTASNGTGSNGTASRRKLLLVGDGPLGNSIDAWIAQDGNDRVKRLPWQANVAPLIRACRVLVLPSRYEGMPNVIMEAMAAGRPVVCARIEGATELLSYDWQSQTFDVGDHPSMAERIVKFTSDASIADEIGLQNQQRMRNDFSVAAMVDAYRSHYRTLLRRRLDRSPDS